MSSRLKRKLRSFLRKRAMTLFLGGLIVAIVAGVGFLMYMLTSPDWRARW